MTPTGSIRLCRNRCLQALRLLSGLAAVGWHVQVLTAAPLPYEDSRFGVFGTYSAAEYEIFKTRTGFTDAQYWSWADNHFRNLNARWTRSTMQLIWDMIEPTLDQPYNWNVTDPCMTDSVITNIYKDGNQINWLGVFREGTLFGEGSGRNPLGYTNSYCRFVRAAVERYDGDGIDDASPFVRVRYWQLGNEIPQNPNPEKRSNYVSWVKLSAEAIRAADPEARIVLIADTQGVTLKTWSSNVVQDLAAGNWFDVIDVHYWSSWDKYKMTGVKDLRLYLDSLGKTNVQIWSGENGTWAYQPTGEVYQAQEDQARGLIRRYVYNIDLGLDKLFWENLVEWANFGAQTGSIFNSMGLIGDGLGNSEPGANLNVPRVSYYAYKMLAAAIDTDQARYIGKMDVHQEPDLYAYRFEALSTNRPSRYILWRDSGTQSVTFAIHTSRAGVTNLITDALGNLRTAYVTNADSLGNLTVEVGLDPMLVEEIVDPPQFRGLVFQPGSGLMLDLESVAGRRCVIEAATNLSNWTSLCTGLPVVTSWSVLDTSATNIPLRFYRARQLNE